MAGGLWGLRLWDPVRDASLTAGQEAVETLVGFGGLTGALDGGGFVVVVVVPARYGAALVARRRAASAGACDARYQQVDAGRTPCRHEVSHWQEGRHASGRGSVPRVIMAPPQQGHRSVAGTVPPAPGCSSGLGASVPSSLRQSAIFAARWPLARRP